MSLSPITGVMAANKIPPQMANFQTFYLTAFYSFLAAETAHFAHCYFVLHFSISVHFQQILVFRNAPNCSSVHIGMTGISLSELALHNRGGECHDRMEAGLSLSHYHSMYVGCGAVEQIYRGILTRLSTSDY